MAGILKARKKHSLLSLARSVKIISAGKDFVWNSSPLFLAHLNQSKQFGPWASCYFHTVFKI